MNISNINIANTYITIIKMVIDIDSYTLILKSSIFITTLEISRTFKLFKTSDSDIPGDRASWRWEPPNQLNLD